MKLVRRCHRTVENYYVQNAIGGNPINLFTKDMPMGKQWNVYRAIIFKGIEDLPIGKITIKPFFGHWDHSNVYKIRVSNTKDMTYIYTQLQQVWSPLVQNARTENLTEQSDNFWAQK